MNARPHPLSRYRLQGEARELYRRTSFVTTRELLDALNNIIANIESDGAEMDYCKKQLVDAACDLDSALYEPEPELGGVDKRGEYDAQTAGVRR